MLQRILYVSRAAEGVGSRDAYDIIRTAHNRNSRDGLTGALLFADGYFVQVLEGDRFNLDECYARIAADERHTDLELRQHCEIEAPSFPGEWMALKSGDQVPDAVKDEFGYAPGVPADRLGGDRLHAFMLACWNDAQHAAG